MSQLPGGFSPAPSEAHGRVAAASAAGVAPSRALGADPAAASPSARPRWAAWALAGLGAALWLGLCTWRLGSVPGMSLDEAWSILSARGEWPPVNPLSGMTPYAGPFPVLLLQLLGTERGVMVLRVTSLAANAATLVSLGLMLRRACPRARDAVWALPLLATAPVWLVVLRTGIEVAMFMPLLVVLGLQLALRRTRAAEFAAGLAWGLAIYSHVIAACFVAAIALAAWRVLRRQPLLAPRWALLGGLLGLAPRLVALAAFPEAAESNLAQYKLLGALGDLRWLPLCLWRTLHGDTVYLRYVGRLALEPWPYWLLGLVFLAPWLRRRGAPWPAAARFVLYATLASSVLITLAAPYIAVRFMVLPVLGFSAGLVLLGAAAIERDAAWRPPIAAAAALISLGNVFYAGADFYRPWQRDELGITKFFLGDRSKNTGNWAYFPKEELVRELRALAPPPEQIVTVPTLERPLRVLLRGEPVRVALAVEADHSARSVFVDYLWPDSPERHCAGTPTGEMCFEQRAAIAKYFVIYRDDGR